VTAIRATERLSMTGDPPPTDPVEQAGPVEQADPARRFSDVFDAYFAEIHRYAAKRLGPDAAADVAAQAFLEAFRQRRRYDPHRASVRTWLYGIATKVIGRHQRADQVDERVSAQGLRAELARAIAALPRGQRDVLLLIALAGLGHDEVAQALGIPYGTVASPPARPRPRRGARPPPSNP
jgi:RNA polymerase sigma factor (sigma-70 family)